jgi:acyl-CoA hydrolase
LTAQGAKNYDLYQLMKKTREGKSPKESETIKTEVVFPNDTNPMGMLQGGRLVQWMDIAAAVCAQTHAGKICVTASIDRVAFNASARVGDIVVVRAVATRAYTTSMEIYVMASARNIINREEHRVSEAYFTFVALDSHAHPTAVPPLVPETSEELQRHKGALVRKKVAGETRQSSKRK